MVERKLKVRVKPTRLKRKRICVRATTYTRKDKRISRRPYCYIREPSIRKGFVAERPDIGLPGRGIKRIPELKTGLVTQEVKKMGYEKFGDVPEGELSTLAKRLVRRFGCRSAMGKAQAQVVFRKRLPDGIKRKFIKLREEVVKVCS